MKPNVTASQLGLPLLKGPVRFAVGPPDGLTSNAWKIWTGKAGDIYIACRDNFKEVKVSLHASGRWRMGFTAEALSKNERLLLPDENRAWEVWDEPPASLPGAVVAFKLLFPTSELAVRPDQRGPKQWQGVMHIESAPPGKATAITLFVTEGAPALKHESEPSFCLASLPVGSNRRAQLVAHTDPSDGLDQFIENGVSESRKRAEAAGVQIPDEGYFYLYGRHANGCRFILGARAARGEGFTEKGSDRDRG